MPVAFRTRSWEDHVASRSRKQYSYDDLDLVCCHAAVEGSGSPTGGRQRVRCASMPECCRHLPSFEGCPGETYRNRRRKTLSAIFKGIAASYEGKKGQTFIGHTFVKVRRAMAEEDIIQSNSSHDHPTPISNNFLYESRNEIHKEGEELTSQILYKFSANAIEEQAKKIDFSMTSKIKNVSKDNAKISFSETIPNPKTQGEPMPVCNVGDPLVEASMQPHQQVEKTGVEANVKVSYKLDPEASLGPDEHSDVIINTALSEIPKNSVIPEVIVNIPNSSHDQVVTSKEVLQVHTLSASTEPEFAPSGSASNSDKSRDSHSKLNTIPEVSFPELGEKAPGTVMENMPGSGVTVTLVDLKGAGNSNDYLVQMETQKGTPEAGSLGNEQHCLAGVLADCESSLESRTEASDHAIILQTSPNMDDVEKDPKPQEVPVRLRTRKVSYADLFTWQTLVRQNVYIEEMLRIRVSPFLSFPAMRLKAQEEINVIMNMLL